MRNEMTVTNLLGACLIMLLLLPACSNDSSYTSPAPTVPASLATIDIAQQTSSPGIVRFSHTKHVGYELVANNCMNCHLHSGVSNDPTWPCEQCHGSGGIAEQANVCDNTTEPGYDAVHRQSCITRQCYDCHLSQAVHPTPLCENCHVAAGMFADSAVQGLQYQANTWSGTTSPGGAYKFIVQDPVTFRIGDVVLGTVSPIPFVTPLSLVPGATSVNDQTVTNIARFLQSLDSDDNPANGITLPADLAARATGRTIDFAVDTMSFENNPDLQAILGFYGKTLIAAGAAQNHLQATIDARFPPAVGTRIGGAPNTHFVLQGLTTETPGVAYTYQWYSADDSSGTNETPITGATGKSLQPTVTETGKYLLFEVTPDTVGGMADRSAWLGPVTDATTVTFVSTLDSPSQVDQFHFILPATTSATFDILSWEPQPGGGTFTSPDFFGNGNNNDYLVCNIYLFQAGGTPVFERAGANPFYDWSSRFNGRSRRNPYVSMPGSLDTITGGGATLPALPAGEYVFAIGANMLSQTDAWNGSNQDGATWNDLRYDFSTTPETLIPNQNHYQVIFSFTY